MINKKTSHWYAIHPDNLKAWEIKGITFWGKKMMLWKSSNWNYVLQSRYCTHFWVDLTKWKIVNDQIECPFHGFQFDKKWENKHCLPKLKYYHTKVFLWMVWFFNGEEVRYKLEDILRENDIHFDLNRYHIINTYNKTYPLPTALLASNFFDANHFKKVHGVEVEDYKILSQSKYLTFEFHGKYFSYFEIQKLLFKVIPNKVYSKIIYSKNCMISCHQVRSKSGKVIFEYYGVFPSTPINETETLIVSNILVKKWFFGFLAKLCAKNILYKATTDEFDMLTGMNSNIRNYVVWDDLLKIYLDFYDKEYTSL